jgi:CheY-like chemotaxis protein
VVTAPSLERPDALAGAERAGAQAVLPKPLDLPHLLALVQNAAAARAA